MSGWSIDDSKVAAWVVATEGSIQLNRYLRPDKRRTGYSPSVKVDNSSEQLIVAFSELVGYGVIRKYNGSTTGKVYYCWQISNQEEIRMFLEWILPHLPIKVEQAKLVAEFCSRREFAPHNSPFTEREHWIYSRMRELNAGKGPKREVARGVVN